MTKEPVNRYLVALQGDEVIHLKHIPCRMSRNDARSLAYWLIATAEEDEGDGDGMREALRELVSEEHEESAQLTCSRCGQPRPTLLMPYCNACYSIVARDLGGKRY